MRTTVLIALCFTMCSFGCSAGSTDTGAVLPCSVFTNSTVRFIELADSFSRIGDSTHASAAYLNIDPFFFVSSGRTPETIDSSFANYSLTSKTKDAYRGIFIRAYNAPRTQSWVQFKAMKEEDQAVRRGFARAVDNSSRAHYNAKMEGTDSLHSEYLFRYVTENGWPTYENGAMFAEVIAMHDTKYMEQYLPYVRQSVVKGNASARFYNNLLNRVNGGSKALRLYRNKRVFDISYVLAGSKPADSQLLRIKKEVQQYGPIKHLYFVFESEQKNNFQRFLDDDNYWIAWWLLEHVNSLQGVRQNGHDLPWSFNHEFGKGGRQRLLLYLLY